MRTDRLYNMENKIDTTLEMSSVCRGEWCRSLESDVDTLENELRETVVNAGRSVDKARIEAMSKKIRRAYRNLGPDIHL